MKKCEIIKENRHAILTLVQTPYVKDHLLVVPKKHHLKLSSMTKAEKDALNELVYDAIDLLYKKYKNVNVLYRGCFQGFWEIY